MIQDRFKFRVWDKNNKMFEKCNFYVGHNGCLYYTLIDNHLHKLIDDDYVIMQCTGLKDKNGALIYEGDIVRSIGSEKSIYQCRWFNDHAAFRLVGVNNKYAWDMLSEICADGDVIGNIYENPELLEREEK